MFFMIFMGKFMVNHGQTMVFSMDKKSMRIFLRGTLFHSSLMVNHREIHGCEIRVASE